MSRHGTLTFVTKVYPSPPSETNVLLLVESIRAFGGSLAGAPIWCYTPDYGKPLSPSIRKRFENLAVTLVSFPMDREVLQFPFTAEVTATALAETTLGRKTEYLAWLDSNTLVLQEPRAFLLPPKKQLGVRPVHHTLVGSRYEDPLDPFWTQIYRSCGVPEEHVFPMTTHVDGARIRPYFNAGFLITRPESRLFRKWRDRFFALYQTPVFRDFYTEDLRYTIFMHQAILTGVILATFSPQQLQELPPTYNYPVHLHLEDVTPHRPTSLEEVVTFRHEGFHQDPQWAQHFPANPPLKSWIAKKILKA